MINKTYLPHTYENQTILREYGAKIAGRMGREVHIIEGPGLWSRIWSYFPSSQAIGYKAGEHLALAYGAQWSNSTIDFVVSRFFETQTQSSSFWSWGGIRGIFFGATQVTLAETLKLTLTPKAMPYVTLISATIAAVGVPIVVYLVSLTYQKIMFDPRKLQQLSPLNLDQHFTIDSETGRLRDNFGRLMSDSDTRDIWIESAKYDLIRKLIDLCHQVDLIDDEEDALQETMQEMLETLAESYYKRQSDGELVFSDGHFCTKDEKEDIRRGIADLSRINPCQKAQKIRKLIKLLARHSFAQICS